MRLNKNPLLPEADILKVNKAIKMPLRWRWFVEYFGHGGEDDLGKGASLIE
jgi:hypothetical protein